MGEPHLITAEDLKSKIRFPREGGILPEGRKTETLPESPSCRPALDFRGRIATAALPGLPC